MTFVQVLAKLLELPEFELRDHDVLPGLACADERNVHELEHRSLAKGLRNHLGAPALFAEQALEQVGRARGAPMRDRQLKVRDASVEVFEETGGCAWVVTLVAGDKLWLC
nr:hypothetical protein [Pelomicrobium methylotrophicum]